MSGVKHIKNSYNKFGEINEICKPYIDDLEKRYKKNKAYHFSSWRGSDEQLESQHRSHLWRVFWYTYLQSKKSRKRKQCLRKIFKYWYGCPNSWGERNNDFWNYDLMCPWPLFCTSQIKSPAGNPIVFPKIRNILMFNGKALYANQFGEVFRIFAKIGEEIINSKS